MGMAASQARLLTITARMHDIEYQAQSIQNAKLALATESDQVYQEYVEALDAQTLTVKDWQGNVIAANFDNLCGIDAVDSTYKYALFDDKGRLIVSKGIAEQYKKYMQEAGSGADAYGFAFYMLGNPDVNSNIDAASFCQKYMELVSALNIRFFKGEKQIVQGSTNGEENGVEEEEDPETQQSPEDDPFKYFTHDYNSEVNLSSENTDKINELDDDKYLKDLLETIYTFYNSKIYGKNPDDETVKEFDTMLKGYLNQLSVRYGDVMYEILFQENGNQFCNREDFDDDMQSDFNYYVSIFYQIQANGGSCVSVGNMANISDYDGFDGDAAHNSDWLQSMIKSGKITVSHVITDKKTGDVTFSSTGVPSDSVLEYSTTSSIDKTALAKAEAEYEHKTKELDRKDKKFDLDLSKLETQRTALKTEYESVKKVISENIDRTFGIFS